MIQSKPDKVEFESWEIANESFREEKGEQKVGYRGL